MHDHLAETQYRGLGKSNTKLSDLQDHCVYCYPRGRISEA